MNAILILAVVALLAPRPEMEARFIALLKSDATYAAKDFACRQLSVMGSEASVPVLSAMLLEPKTADMARYALERIPGPAVNRALRQSLAKTSGAARIGIINTLGRRRDTASVAVLRRLASGTDRDAARAALAALGEIAGPVAVRALAEAYARSTGPLHESAAEAWLGAAGRMPPAAALPIYRKLYAAVADPAMIRVAALNGIARAGGPVPLAALHNETALQTAAIRALPARQLVPEIPHLSEAAQVRALAALAERADVAGLPAFTAALERKSKPVRLAALEGLAAVGNASTVPLLAAIAAGEDDAERTAARSSLALMRGTDVDRAVVDSIAGAAPKVKLELIRAAGKRAPGGASEVLLKTARDADTAVRRESLRALRDTARDADMPQMIALVTNPVRAGDPPEAVRSLAALLRRSDPSRIGDLLSAYHCATDAEARAALLQVMGQSGNARALPILRGGLNSSDAGLKRAAILALADWPDPAPIADLLDTARTAGSPAHQVLALRGALRLMALPAPDRSSRETVKLLAQAMSLARQADEKRTVLSLLARFPTSEALDLARASLNDSDVGAEARLAVERIERTLKNRGTTEQ